MAGKSAINPQYVTSAPTIKEAPVWTLPEIALVGRSNVGKSSLINTLLGRKQLAKTSNTPGKTRLLNFYNIDERFSFVDLPGYGYAKVSKTMQLEWQKHFQIYLKERENLKLVIQLIDSRHPPQASDEQMLAWLEEHNLSVILVMTKIDKLSKNDIQKHLVASAKQLGVPLEQLFSFSSQTGLGKSQLWNFINGYLEEV